MRTTCQRVGLRGGVFLLLLWVLSLMAFAEPLRFWAVTGSVKDVEMYRQVARDFERETGVAVEVTPLAWGNFQTKYFTAMAAGLPPDVGVTNLGGPFDYGIVGGLVDLRKEFPEEMRHLEAKFNPGLLDMFTVGDQLFGIPTDLGLLVLYYRTDTFARLGLKPPTTWSEMNEVIDRLEAAGYRYYYGFTNGTQWSLGMFTLPYGLPGLRSRTDGTPEVLWNEPDYQKGVMQALRMWHFHDSPGKDLGSRGIGMFRSNDRSTALPFMVDIHSFAGNIADTAPELKGKWAVAPWPRADDGVASHVMGGTTYVMFRQSRQKRAAFDWLKFLHRTDVQAKLVAHRANRGDESSLSISPVNEIWAPENRAIFDVPSLQRMANLTDVVREMLPDFRTVRSLVGSAEVGRMEANLLDQMGSYIRDRMDALGRKHGLSRSELVRKFANGELRSERNQLERDTAARLKAEYAKIQPAAQRLLIEKHATYEERYARIVRELPTFEQRRNVLDFVKGVAGGGFALAFLMVLAVPRYRRHAVSYAFIAVPLMLAVVFVFIPAVTALYLSLTEYHPVLPLSTARWVGLGNYATALASGDFPASLRHTLVYAVWTLPVGIALSLVFAYLLNQKLRAPRLWRFLYFSPLVTSIVSIALIFTQLFLSGKQGWLNALLIGVGYTQDPIPFLASEHTFLKCVIVLAIWHGLAFTILVFLAGLQQIPEELYEAAALDGASPARRFRSVAIPGLRPQLFFVTVLGIIGSFQVFETIYVLAGKSGDAAARFGPNDSALTLVPLIYHTGFETFEMGMSAAYAYLLFLMILVLTIVQFGFYRRKGTE